MIKIRSNIIEKVEEALAPVKNGAATVLRMAINETLQRTKGPLAKQVKEKLAAPLKDIRKAIAISGKASAKSLTGTLAVERGSIRAEKLKPRWSKTRGVAVQMVKGMERFKHAFRATMKSGHTGIYFRKRGAGKTTATGFARRLPIVDVMGPNAATVLVELPDETKRVADGMGERMEERVISKLKWMLEKHGLPPMEQVADV